MTAIRYHMKLSKNEPRVMQLLSFWTMLRPGTGPWADLEWDRADHWSVPSIQSPGIAGCPPVRSVMERHQQSPAPHRPQRCPLERQTSDVCTHTSVLNCKPWSVLRRQEWKKEKWGGGHLTQLEGLGKMNLERFQCS